MMVALSVVLVAVVCGLLGQAVRVFMLARVTPRALSSLPGMLLLKDDTANTSSAIGGRKEEAALATSNAYNISENLLIKWLNYHVTATMPSAVKSGAGVCDLERELRDGAVLCHVLVSHIPKLKEPGMPLEAFFGINKVIWGRTSNTALHHLI